MSTPEYSNLHTLSIPDVAARWRCHHLTVRRRVREGKLKALRFSRNLVRIPLSEVERYEREALV